MEVHKLTYFTDIGDIRPTYIGVYNSFTILSTGWTSQYRFFDIKTVIVSKNVRKKAAPA